MTNTWYNMTDMTDNNSAEVFIYDVIGGHDINAKQFVEDLNNLTADVIHLRINSAGGSVIDGNAIFNALTRHSAKVIAHVDGLAASMASVLAMSGDEIHMADNALIMIHNPWTVSIGDADELRADADLLEKMSDSILNAYSRSQYEKKELQDLMNKETWFTAQEALDAGLIDHIESGLRAAACDITQMAVSSNLSVPADKQIASLSKQLEAVTKSNKEISDQLSTQVVETEEANALLSDSLSALEEVYEQKADMTDKINNLTALNEDQEKVIEAKDIEIAEAKKIAEQEVANKAAEILQTTTHEPVSDAGESIDTPTDSEILTKYEAIADRDDRRDYFAANKTQILRAKSANY